MRETADKAIEALADAIEAGKSDALKNYLSVMARFHAMFAIPDDVGFHFCVPLGYPQGNFGPNARQPTSATTFLDRWGAPVPWE